MKRTICLVVGAVAFFAPLGGAQTASPAAASDQLPPGPLIVPSMPPSAQWTIDFTYKVPSTPESAAAKLAIFKKDAENDPVMAKSLLNPQFVFALTMPRPIRITVTKTGDIRHEEVAYERNFKGEKWSFGQFLVARLP